MPQPRLQFLITRSIHQNAFTYFFLMHCKIISSGALKCIVILEVLELDKNRWGKKMPMSKFISSHCQKLPNPIFLNINSLSRQQKLFP